MIKLFNKKPPQLLIYILFSILLGSCEQMTNMLNSSKLSLSNTGVSPAPIQCPETPPNLDKNTVKNLPLNKDLLIFDVLNPGENVGYTFYGRLGKSINYQVSNNVCLWIYAPDTKLLETSYPTNNANNTEKNSLTGMRGKSLELPLTGQYIVQIGGANTNTKFSLELTTPNQAITALTPNPLNTLSPLPTPTSILPTAKVVSPNILPTPAVTPSPVANTVKATPDIIVKNYYTNINQSKYADAWSQLSPSYKNNPQLHPNGFTSYEEWWKTLQGVELQSWQVLENNQQQATVNVVLKYIPKTGNSFNQSLDILLTWDNISQKWMIDGAKINY
jgi:hypothetical protein